MCVSLRRLSLQHKVFRPRNARWVILYPPYREKNLTQRPQSDVARLLTGQVPGVTIASSGGASGSGTKINIRGYTSISGSTQPLFVVDGVPFNTNTNTQNNFSDGNQSTSSRFLDLDPNNIEDLQVLKGLSATVLYGEQGRNGVILITTKNGAAGRKKKDFEVSVFQSVFANEIASLPDYSKKIRHRQPEPVWP